MIVQEKEISGKNRPNKFPKKHKFYRIYKELIKIENMGIGIIRHEPKMEKEMYINSSNAYISSNNKKPARRQFTNDSMVTPISSTPINNFGISGKRLKVEKEEADIVLHQFIKYDGVDMCTSSSDENSESEKDNTVRQSDLLNSSIEPSESDTPTNNQRKIHLRQVEDSWLVDDELPLDSLASTGRNSSKILQVPNKHTYRNNMPLEEQNVFLEAVPEKLSKLEDNLDTQIKHSNYQKKETKIYLPRQVYIYIYIYSVLWVSKLELWIMGKL